MNSQCETVFVYGTLRRGGSNHFRMEAATFIAKGRISGRMYRIDWYPGLVVDEAGDDIFGEAYAVDLELLGNLDSFEGITPGDREACDYRRVATAVTCDDGQTLTAWVWEWLGEVDEDQRLRSGNWLA